MEKRLEVDLAWKLLAGDLIEGQGNISGNDSLSPEERKDSLLPLARRIAGAVTLPLPFVESKLRKLAERGLLICHQTADSCCWQWKES
jgi:hypothetical protein